MLRNLTILYLKFKALFKPYGYFGHYADWQSATRDASGYDSEAIINRVAEASRIVRDGKAGFEQDSTTGNLEDFSFSFFPFLEKQLASGKRFRVLDFGGGLGSHFYPLNQLLKANNLDWTIIEQEAFFSIGKKEFESDQLHFIQNPDEWSGPAPNLLLLGCVLPYLEQPYQVLQRLTDLKPEYIIVDKHPLVQGRKDRLTLQRIPPTIYSASYPAWFFSEDKWKEALPDYECLEVVDCPDTFNINSRFKSYLYRRKNGL